MNLSLTIATYTLYFFMYSAIGWLVESIYCSLAAKRWINRGFLFGPLCPIYGTGALCIILLLKPFARYPLAVFILGMFVCDVVEYITSVIMEKLFHARWWDYSQKKFNLNGRICLTHTLYWGIGSLVFVYLIHPLLFETLMDEIPEKYRYILLTAVLILFCLDLIRAVKNALDVKKIMDNIRRFSDSVTRGKDLLLNSMELKRESMQQSFTKTGERFTKWRRELISQLTEHRSVLENRDRDAKKRKKGYNRMFIDYPAIAKFAKEQLADMEQMLDEIKNIFNDDEML